MRFYPALDALAVSSSALGLATGCVVGAARPASRLALARDVAEPAAPTALNLSITDVRSETCRKPPGAPPPRPTKDAIWVEGSCHTEGVRAVWIPGAWVRR